jgi:hypothetical protein
MVPKVQRQIFFSYFSQFLFDLLSDYFCTNLTDEGQAFGEVALIKEDCVRTASVVTDDNTDLMVVDRALYNRSVRDVLEREFNEFMFICIKIILRLLKSTFLQFPHSSISSHSFLHPPYSLLIDYLNTSPFMFTYIHNLSSSYSTIFNHIFHAFLRMGGNGRMWKLKESGFK